MPGPGVVVTDHRKKYDELREKVFGLKTPIVIDFGIFGAKGGDARKGVLTVVEIAAVHEFGSAKMGIPPRSFLRAFMDQFQDDLLKLLSNLMESVVEGKRQKKDVLELFASTVVGKIKQRIAQGISPALKPETIRRKNGKATPLIDTGQLRNSITYRVKQGGEDIAFPPPEDAEVTPEQHRAGMREAKKKARAEERSEAKAKAKPVREKLAAAKKSNAKNARDKAKARKAAVRNVKKAIKSKVRDVKKTVTKTIAKVTKSPRGKSRASGVRAGARAKKGGG